MELGNQTEDPGYLKNYLPFIEVDDTSLILIANSAKQINLKAKEILFTIGSVDDECYLLKTGSLELEAEDGKKRIIEEGSPAAKCPIALLKPRKYKVKALGPCEIIAIKDNVLKTVNQGLLVSNVKNPADAQMKVSWGIEDAADVSGKQSLASQLIKEIKDGTSPLPSIPKVALKVHELVDSDANNSEIAHHISMDPAIAAKLIAIANSVFYQGNKTCTDLPLAISRIGTQVVKQLVFSFALKDKFNSKDKFLNRLLISSWQESIEVSARCFALANYISTLHKNNSLQKDKALLAGLFHNIGCIPIIKFFESRKDKISEDEINMILDNYKNEAGAILLSSWKFSEEITCIPENAGVWSRDHEGEADYLDLVLLCQLIYKTSRANSNTLTLPDIHTLPAYKKLVKGDNQMDISEIVEAAAKDQVDEIRRLLQ